MTLSLLRSRWRPMGMLVSCKWISNNSHWWFQFFMLHCLQLLCWYFTLSIVLWLAQSIISYVCLLNCSRTYRRDQIFKEAIFIKETCSDYTTLRRSSHFNCVTCLYDLLHLSKEHIFWTNPFSLFR